jgi:hypothetical protein
MLHVGFCVGCFSEIGCKIFKMIGMCSQIPNDFGEKRDSKSALMLSKKHIFAGACRITHLQTRNWLKGRLPMTFQ